LVRAAVLIGVSQTGNLQTPKAVHDGVRAMERWALGQGMDRELVKVLSDEGGPVEVGQVKKAVKEIVDLTTVNQLIVYFSGHGVNISRGEYWLLSGAPEDSNAAVNVAGSIELARTCGIRHVVLISDACRTAAEGIQGQGIRGSEIFPNVLDAVEERPVDVFFACGLGDPALEVKNPKKAAAGYRAVYTDSLAQALGGKKNVAVKHPEKNETVQLIEVDRSGAKPRGLIRPVPLSLHLRADVLARLTKAKVKPGVHQTPVARIISQETWLAEVPVPPAAFDGLGSDSGKAAFSEPAIQTIFEESGRMLAGTLAQNRVLAADPASAGQAELAEPLGRIFQPFGPRHFETSCGFKVRGAKFASALGAGVKTNIPDPERQILSVQGVAEGAANLLIEFDDGTGLVLPAIRDYVGSITVEDGAVVNVSFEPVENSARWQALEGREDEVRSLRALLASSARLGVFRLRDADAGLMEERMKVGRGLDPSIALYAAYAYHDRQEAEPVRAMQKAIFGDLKVRLFDLALLAGELRGRQVRSEKRLFPFVPLLSQGWALLRAQQTVLPPGLEALGDHRVESLWTLFDPQGVELIRSAIKTKEID
jgi:hypothetical protein